MSEWSDRWQLKFNVSKCGIIHYGRQQVDFTYSMSEEGKRRNLKVMTEEKDLGVKFDASLSFSKHVSMIANKANQIVGIIRRTFTFMDEIMLKTLYKSLVRPNLEYANCIWSPMYNKDEEIIEKVQRRATKLVRNLHDLTYEERLQKLNLPTLAYRRKRGDLIQVYKIMHGLNDMQKDELFEMATGNVDTRGHNLKIFKRRSTLKLRSHSFTNRIVNSWNCLPANVVNAKSINSFKNGVDKALSKTCDKFTFGVERRWQKQY